MLITKISSTEHPIQTMAMAAATCYFSGEQLKDSEYYFDTEHYFDSTYSEQLDKCVALLNKVLSHKHMSILEHCSYTFAIEGISRNCSHQIVRHRHMSFAQQSLHYTPVRHYKVIQPRVITYNQKEELNDIMKKAFNLYTTMIANGIDKEDARQVLPSGIETKIICTANLRQWLQFISVRACNVNCFEIKKVALGIWQIIVKDMPFLASYLGPTCATEGVCNEGKKYCGRPFMSCGSTPVIKGT